mgnify:CR=1 FL=1
MPARRRLNARDRERLFDLAGGVCHICETPIDLRCEAYEIDHVQPFAISRDNSDANLKPAHTACHKRKTHGDERRAIRKTDRIRAKFLGHHPKPIGNGRIPSRPFYNPRSAN